LLAIYVCWWKVTDGVAIDAHAYWAVNMADPYSSAMRSPLDAYLYSPAFAQLIAPLRALPWEWFIRIWTALEGAALVLLAGPFTLLVLFAEPTLYELDLANINLLIALALVAGFRWPAAWAFILLTKVTPGVGLIWFAVRRQWRSLAVAIIVTGALAGPVGSVAHRYPAIAGRSGPDDPDSAVGEDGVRRRACRVGGSWEPAVGRADRRSDCDAPTPLRDVHRTSSSHSSACGELARSHPHCRVRSIHRLTGRVASAAGPGRDLTESAFPHACIRYAAGLPV
jgi:hypothetical protein